MIARGAEAARALAALYRGGILGVIRTVHHSFELHFAPALETRASAIFFPRIIWLWLALRALRSVVLIRLILLLVSLISIRCTLIAANPVIDATLELFYAVGNN